MIKHELKKQYIFTLNTMPLHSVLVLINTSSVSVLVLKHQLILHNVAYTDVVRL